MSAPLTKPQKQHLALLARRAYNRACALARGAGRSPAADPDLADGFDAWRHRQTAAACGKLGLRCASQDDYQPIRAHLLNLLGEPGLALNAHLAAQTQPRRVAEWKLVHECQAAGFQLAYADKICRAQNHGAGLQDVDTPTLWRLIYTIRNRAAARRKQAA